MGRYILRRLVQSIAVLIGVTLLVFLLLQVAGDPVVIMLSGTGASEADVQAMRDTLGLNDPAPIRYGRFVAGLVRGDLGDSLRSRQPALPLVLDRLPATVLLATTALVFAVIVAVPIGITSALRPNSLVDHVGRTIAVVGQATPVFWLGIMLVLLFAVRLGWLPAGGYGTWKHLVLPAFALGLLPTARISRLLRSSLLEVFGQDYVRTAWAKGLHTRHVVLVHALRNAALPVVTIIGLTFGSLLGGAVVTETIFAWPGVGQLAVFAITSRDINLVQAIVVVVAILFVLVNLLVDLLYAWLNPTIRYE